MSQGHCRSKIYSVHNVSIFSETVISAGEISLCGEGTL
jgi:hypothetical protein